MSNSEYKDSSLNMGENELLNTQNYQNDQNYKIVEDIYKLYYEHFEKYNINPNKNKYNDTASIIEKINEAIRVNNENLDAHQKAIQTLNIYNQSLDLALGVYKQIRDEYKNLVKDKEYLKKQNENIKRKFNELTKSFDKYIWESKNRESKLRKRSSVNPKTITKDLNDFNIRLNDTFSYYYYTFFS